MPLCGWGRQTVLEPGQNRKRVGQPIEVTAFVDWRAQMHNTGVLGRPLLEAARRTLDRTARLVGRALNPERARFRVSLRLYHGWHKGWQPTDGFKAATQAVGETDLAGLSQDRVAFSPAVQFGHTLLAAALERQHPRPAIHLPNTLRNRVTGPPAEKMVDTALAADLLAWAHLSPSEWALVLAEDDDVVPPLFATEALIQPHGGRALLLRKRQASQYLRLDGLLRQLS